MSWDICLIMSYFVYMPIKLQHESPGCCCTGAALEQPHGYVKWGYVTAMLWLCYGCGYSCCISQEGGCVMAVHTVSWTQRRQGELRGWTEAWGAIGNADTFSSYSPWLPWKWCEQQDNWRHEQDQQYNYYDSQKGETTQMSITWWMDKQNVAYTYNRIVFSSKKTKLLLYCYHMYEPWRHHVKWKNASHRGPHVIWTYYITFWKCPE